METEDNLLNTTTIRISKDLCGAYESFSVAMAELISDRLRYYCQAASVENTENVCFSLTSCGSGGSFIHNLFVLRIWQAKESDKQRVTENTTTTEERNA